MNNYAICLHKLVTVTDSVQWTLVGKSGSALFV